MLRHRVTLQHVTSIRSKPRSGNLALLLYGVVPIGVHDLPGCLAK